MDTQVQESNQPLPTPHSNHFLVLLATGISGLIFFILGLFLGHRFPSNPPTPVTTPIPTSSTAPIPTLDVTANWKTYTDDINGFSLKYPETWNSVAQKFSGENSVALSPAEVGQLKLGAQVQSVDVWVHNNPKHLTSKEYFEQVIKPSQEGSVCKDFLVNKRVPSSLNGLDVTIIEGLCGVLEQGPRMLVSKPDYIVDVSSGFLSYKDIDDDLIYHILSTFKFLDQRVDISNWKTFQNKYLDVTFKYPPDWRITYENSTKGAVFWTKTNIDIESPAVFLIEFVDRNNKSIDEFIKRDQFPYQVIKNIKVGSSNGILVSDPVTAGNGTYIAFLPSGDEMLVLTLNFDPPGLSVKPDILFDQILSTLQILK